MYTEKTMLVKKKSQGIYNWFQLTVFTWAIIFFICCLTAFSKLWNSLLPSNMSKKLSTLLSVSSSDFNMNRENSADIQSSDRVLLMQLKQWHVHDNFSDFKTATASKVYVSYSISRQHNGWYLCTSQPLL